jgi:rubrerythrin
MAPHPDARDGRPPEPPDDGCKPWPDDRPGDSVCWLRLVCPACGAMAEAEPPADCPQCGTRIVTAR